MPMPPFQSAFGHTPSAITTPACWPSVMLAYSSTAPRALPMRTRAPSTTPSNAASAGQRRTVGRTSRVRDPLVSVKVEFRNWRGGGATRRNGPAPSVRSAWSGRAGSPAVCGPSAAQSGAKRKRPSGKPKPVRWWLRSNAGWASTQRLARRVSILGQPETRSVSSAISSAVMPKPRCSAPSRSASTQTTSWLERASPGGGISWGPSWMWLWPPAW